MDERKRFGNYHKDVLIPVAPDKDGVRGAMAG